MCRCISTTSTNPFAGDPFGRGKGRAPANADPFADDPFGRGKGRAPANADPFADDPFGRGKGRAPANADPFADDPFGRGKGRAPANADPFADDPFGRGKGETDKPRTPEIVQRVQTWMSILAGLKKRYPQISGQQWNRLRDIYLREGTLTAVQDAIQGMSPGDGTDQTGGATTPGDGTDQTGGATTPGDGTPPHAPPEGELLPGDDTTLQAADTSGIPNFIMSQMEEDWGDDEGAKNMLAAAFNSGGMQAYRALRDQMLKTRGPADEPQITNPALQEAIDQALKAVQDGGEGLSAEQREELYNYYVQPYLDQADREAENITAFFSLARPVSLGPPCLGPSGAVRPRPTEDSPACVGAADAVGGRVWRADAPRAHRPACSSVWSGVGRRAANRRCDGHVAR